MKKTALLCLLALSCGCAARTRRFIGYRLSGKAPLVSCRADGPAKWCVHAPKGAASRDIVYFFHYATGDERSWDRLGLARAFYGEYSRLGKPAPRAVSVSYGTHWLLTKTPGRRQTVALDDFSALRRRIEAELGAPERRYVWGMSLGGYNAAALTLSEPGLWSAAVLSCPALQPSSPYIAPPAERFARGAEGREAFTSRLAGEPAWAAENPLALAAAAGPLPPFSIEADTDDEFGFFPGAQALSQTLKKSGASVDFTATRGPHCLIDARADARFLAGLQPR